MTPGEKLVRWRRENGMTQRAAAKLAGLSHATWHAYESGGLPRTPAAVAIERVTNGAVAVGDWVESEEDRAVRRARAASKRVRTATPESTTTLPDDDAHEGAA